ncbi:MAG: hypothetical protein RL885_33390 [Planctomycetota bacterium]
MLAKVARAGLGRRRGTFAAPAARGRLWSRLLRVAACSILLAGLGRAEILEVPEVVFMKSGQATVQIHAQVPHARVLLLVNTTRAFQQTPFGELGVKIDSNLSQLGWFVADASGELTLKIPIPEKARALGRRFWIQAFIADPSRPLQPWLSRLETTLLGDEFMAPRGMFAAVDTGLTYDPGTETYVFWSNDEPLYRWQARGVASRGGYLDIEHVPSGLHPVSSTGPSYFDESGQRVDGASLKNHIRLLEHYPASSRSVRAVFETEISGQKLPWELTLRIAGRTMVARTRALEPVAGGTRNFGGYFLGASRRGDWQDHFFMPLVQYPILFRERGERTYFATRYLDLTRSSATRLFQNVCPQPAECFGTADIEWTTSGQVLAPLDETLYVTVSESVMDVIERSVASPSQYYDELRNKLPLETFVMFNDLSRLYPQQLRIAYGDRYGAAKQMLDDFLYLGMKEVYGIWQLGWAFPYTPFPELDLTQDQEARLFDLLRYCDDKGIRFAPGWPVTYVAEDSYYYHPQNPALAFDSDGNPKVQFVDPITGVKHYAVTYPGQVFYVEKEILPLKTGCPSLNSYFIDSDFKQAYDFKISSDTTRLGARTMAESIQQGRGFAKYLRKLIDGPLFAEGYGGGNSGESGNTFEYIGYIDGQERELPGAQHADIIPHFALHETGPLVANRGPYLSRFYSTGGNEVPFDQIDYDRYFAVLLAFNLAQQPLWAGASVFDSNQVPLTLEQVYWRAANTYYRSQQLQAEYKASRVDKILYWAESRWMKLEEALVLPSFNFRFPRLLITYENGLVLIVNLGKFDWTASVPVHFGPVQGSIELPPSGYIAFRFGDGADPEHLAYSGNIQGHRVDYLQSDSYVYANGRGVPTDFGPLSAEFVRVLLEDGTEVRCDPLYGCERLLWVK